MLVGLFVLYFAMTVIELRMLTVSSHGEMPTLIYVYGCLWRFSHTVRVLPYHPVYPPNLTNNVHLHHYLHHYLHHLPQVDEQVHAQKEKHRLPHGPAHLPPLHRGHGG